MKIFALSDFHLSINSPKPMDVFGEVWDGYWEKIKQDWNRVSEDDLVLIAGDLSWAMCLEAAKPDLEEIGKLSGRKILLRGNHDYWWSSIKQIRACLPAETFALQNDCIRVGNVLVVGTRCWTPVDENSTAEDVKIYAREVERLKLSLKDMQRQRQEGDVVVGMVHFPPFDATFQPTEFTKAFAEAGVKSVVYGHLHGKYSRVVPEIKIDGVSYFLTSCDLVNHSLVEIMEL